MKQMLIYDNAVPLTREAHGKLSLKKPANYEFARKTNSVPAVIGEFAAAAQDYAIVFAGADEGVVPALVLGVRDNENSYLSKDGNWTAPYIPAFVRRYPFIFGTDAKAENFTLMIDEGYDGFNKSGKGERLFDADGERTAFLDSSLNFAREYQAQAHRTQQFGVKLRQLGLLDAVEAHTPLPQEPERRLRGFFVVNRDRLKALPGETLAGLIRSDELELIYLHLFSLQNLGRVAQKAAEAVA